MLQWIRRHLTSELLIGMEWLFKEFEEIVSALDELKTAITAVSAQLTQLQADIEAKLVADAAALADAQASAVTSEVVASVQALGIQATNLGAIVNPSVPQD